MQTVPFHHWPSKRRSPTNKSSSGSFTYSHATGYNILGQPEEIKEDALFFLASSTKLLTSIAALQTVDQGLIGLDDDVAKHLPELAELPIIKGFDVEEAILEKRKNTITLRYPLLAAPKG